jgi:hypothetical protein
VLEIPMRLVFWGQIRLGKPGPDEFERRLAAVVRRYEPNELHVEVLSSRRGAVARARVDVVVNYARAARLRVRRLAAPEVRQSLGLPTSATKHELSESLGQVFPELQHRMPRKMAWRRDSRMYVFEAIALAAASTSRGGRRRYESTNNWW